MASNGRRPPPAPIETKINVWLNIAAIIVPLLVTLGGGLVFLGSITTTIKDQISGVGKDVDMKIQPLAAAVGTVSQKVDSTAKDAQAKVDILSTKVDANNTLTQTKQDILAETFKANQQDQATFRANVQQLFSKVFDSQQKLVDQVNQERVDRLTEASKKK
jgi:hypothetical protein